MSDIIGLLYGGLNNIFIIYRFSNVNFARISALQGHMELDLHMMTYDINCQYCKN